MENYPHNNYAMNELGTILSQRSKEQWCFVNSPYPIFRREVDMVLQPKEYVGLRVEQRDTTFVCKSVDGTYSKTVELRDKTPRAEALDLMAKACMHVVLCYRTNGHPVWRESDRLVKAFEDQAALAHRIAEKIGGAVQSGWTWRAIKNGVIPMHCIGSSSTLHRWEINVSGQKVTFFGQFHEETAMQIAELLKGSN